MDDERLKQLQSMADNAPNDVMRKAILEAIEKYKQTKEVTSPFGKMGDLSEQLLDFNSPIYQQYSQFLQKNTPQIGVNTLLAPLLAGGASYGGSQAIAGKRAQAMAGQRQDAIQTGVQGFALGNIGQGANLLGQQGNMGMGFLNLGEQQRQFDQSNSPWGAIGGLLGGALGMFGGFGGGQKPMTAGMPPSQGGGFAYQGGKNMGNPGGWY